MNELRQRKIEISLSPGTDQEWVSSNRALARLLARHRRELTVAIDLAGRIAHAIDRLAPQMAALCQRTCRFCPDPCCITTTVWFDFQDLLFLHLCGASIPICQAVSDPMQACPFLGGHGCRLDTRCRPWMCVQYLCPPQLVIIEKSSSTLAADLTETLATTRMLRAQMEAAVVSCIQRHQELP